MGPQSGYPIFDLRQSIPEAWLDGTNIDPGDLDHHDFGGGLDAELGIVESSALHGAGTARVLRVRYGLGLRQASSAGSYSQQLDWNGDTLAFGVRFTDLGPGR